MCRFQISNDINEKTIILFSIIKNVFLFSDVEDGMSPGKESGIQRTSGNKDRGRGTEHRYS